METSCRRTFILFSSLASLRKVVGKLHPQPRFRRAAKGLRKPNGHFGTDSGPAINHFGKGLTCHTEDLRAGSYR